MRTKDLDEVIHHLMQDTVVVKDAIFKLIRSRYKEHKDSARKRGIPFLLTFDRWLKVWIRSGHLHERGNRIGRYVMARIGDVGPYAEGNVKIITAEENHSEKKQPPSARAAVSGAQTGRGKKLTALDAEHIRASRHLTNKALAEMYRVDRNTISAIVNGKTWAGGN